MYKEIMKGWIKHLDFMLIDIVCLETGLLLAYAYRMGIEGLSMPKDYRMMILAIAVIDICTVFFCNSYEKIVFRGYLVEIRQALVHCAVVSVGLIVWMFMIKESSTYSRIVVFLMYPVSVCLMIVARLAWKRVLRIRLRNNKKLRKVLVVTLRERASKVVGDLLTPYRDYKVDAVVIYDGPVRPAETIYRIPVVADRNRMMDYIKDNIVDEVFIDLGGNGAEEERLMNLFVNMGLTAHVNLIQFGDSVQNKRVNRIGDCMVLSSSMKFASPGQIIAKRIMDIMGAIVGLIITGIAFVIYAPIIYRQSPGPIFFGQMRVGRNGRTFRIYKFRSMYLDAEERKKELMEQNKMKGFMFKMDDDPRIIPIGHFMRKTSIDELPQFWNILNGDMSLVGTRPPTVDEYEQYDVKHRRRLAMKPGLTGLWQISGRSDIVDFDEVVKLDAMYIENWSLSYDIKIIWRTIGVVLMRKGSV